MADDCDPIGANVFGHLRGYGRFEISCANETGFQFLAIEPDLVKLVKAAPRFFAR